VSPGKKEDSTMNWSPEFVQRVWEKGRIVPENDPNHWRKDYCGAWIGRRFHGDRNSEYGWEIDHISPDGPDILSNLRPLQWQNNMDKGDGRLKCNVTAGSTHNILR